MPLGKNVTKVTTYLEKSHLRKSQAEYADLMPENYIVTLIGARQYEASTSSGKYIIYARSSKEYECALRERIDEIVKEEKRKIWSKAQNWIGDDMVPYIINAIVDIEDWFPKWGSLNTILDCPFDEISKMFTVPPILWEKEYLLLKCYSVFQVGNIEEVRKLFIKYSNGTFCQKRKKKDMRVWKNA